MTYDLRFLPEVEDDVIAGYSWYEEKVRGLGEEFLRMFYACANELSRNAMLYQKVYGDFRRRLLRRFPYAIYFLMGKTKSLFSDSSIVHVILELSNWSFRIEINKRP